MQRLDTCISSGSRVDRSRSIPKDNDLKVAIASLYGPNRNDKPADRAQMRIRHSPCHK